MSKKSHKNTRHLQQMGYSTVDIYKIRETVRKETEAINDENKKAYEKAIAETHEKAFLYMLAIPLNVLVDMWGEEEAKKKAPEFIDEVCNLYEAVQDGYVTDEQLAELLEDMAGLKITAEWLKKKGE